MIYNITAIYCDKVYPLAIHRDSLEDALKAVKCILPGCTIVND